VFDFVDGSDVETPRGQTEEVIPTGGVAAEKFVVVENVLDDPGPRQVEGDEVGGVKQRPVVRVTDDDGHDAIFVGMPDASERNDVADIQVGGGAPARGAERCAGYHAAHLRESAIRVVLRK